MNTARGPLRAPRIIHTGSSGMKRRIFENGLAGAHLLLAAALLVAGCASAPVVDDSTTTKKLDRLKSKQAWGAEKKVVTIYKFRSAVPEMHGENATDMFTTALVKSGAFAVAERQRLNDGVMAERQMNAQGLTSGSSSQSKLAGADYIFEGALTEANANKSKTGASGTVKGLGLEGSGAKAEIGLDVRVVDARTGVVLDAVNVRKPVKQGGLSVSGIGAFAQSFTKKNLQGADLNLASEHKEGVDRAVRECIEEAIHELVSRYGS